MVVEVMWQPVQRAGRVFGSTIEDWVLNVLLAVTIVLAVFGVRQCSADHSNGGVKATTNVQDSK
jgi:hypothetical protein